MARRASALGARMRARRKEIRRNRLGFLESRSGKQGGAGRGKAIATTGTGRPPMALAVAKVPAMCVLYTFQSRLLCRLRKRGDR